MTANLGTGLTSTPLGHGLSVELNCTNTGTVVFRSSAEDGIIVVTALGSNSGPPNDFRITSATASTALGSGVDTDFDRNEAITTPALAGNAGVGGTFAYSAADGAVISGAYLNAFGTAQGDCDAEGNAVVSS